MAVIKMTRRANELMEGQHVVKEVDGVFYTLVIKDSKPVCFALENPPSTTIDGTVVIPSNSRTVEVYNDFGLFNIVVTSRPMATSAGWGLAGQLPDNTFSAPAQSGPPPQPLVPFAGLDRKPMPPSPPIIFKQMKHQVVADKAASRKINFGIGGDQGQKQISDFFTSANQRIPTDMEF